MVLFIGVLIAITVVVVLGDVNGTELGEHVKEFLPLSLSPFSFESLCICLGKRGILALLCTLFPDFMVLLSLQFQL